jgi:hypothetical protein
MSSRKLQNLSLIIFCLSLLFIPQVNAQVFFSKDTVYQYTDSLSIKNGSTAIVAPDSITVSGRDSIDFDSTYFVFGSRPYLIAYLYQISPYRSLGSFSIPPNDSIILDDFQFTGFYRQLHVRNGQDISGNDSVTIPFVFHFPTNDDTLVFKGVYYQWVTNSIHDPYVLKEHLANSPLNQYYIFDLRGRRLSGTTTKWINGFNPTQPGAYFNVFKTATGETRIGRSINIR